MTRVIGYARVSTPDQQAGLNAQMRELEQAGVLPLSCWWEAASAVGERPVLDEIISCLSAGDQLVVTKLDRLARSVVHLGLLLEQIHAAGASLRILNLGMDTSTPTGKLMLNVLGAVAQFEREMMLERQREGIEAAKLAGKYTGRKPRVDHDLVRDIHKAQSHTPGNAVAVTAEKLGLSVRQVQRILKG